MEEKGRGGGEDQRLWLHASLFAPHVWELLLVCFCLCSSRVDISSVPDSLCCYSVSTLEARALLQPHHLQTGSAKRRHHTEGGANPSWAEGKTGTHAQTHVSIHPSEHKYLTKALAVWQTGCSCLWTKPVHWRGCVSIVRLMCWVNQHTAWANYRLCMKLSGEEQVHTLCMHVCVSGCVCLCQNVRHTTASLLGVVFLYVSPEHQPVSLLSPT